MPTDFVPAKNAEFLSFVTNLSGLITATPTAYGLVAGQATALAGLVTIFTTCYETAIEPTTRTKGTIQARNDARKPLEAMVRDLARIIQAYPSLTNEQRVNLGLTVRKQPSPINPPTEKPVMKVKSADGRLLEVTVEAADSNRRGKPAGVSGCTIFSHVGPTPPSDISQWTFQGSTTRTSFTVEFGPEVPAGSQVWLCGFWKNFRDMSGPACTPISAYIAGGVSQAESA